MIALPPGSLLAEFCGPEDYRDCFERTVPGNVSLGELIERFYCSMAFRPERVLLGLIGRGASNLDAAALARGEADGIAAWKVVGRREPPRSSSKAVAQQGHEILLQDFQGATASWLSVRPGADAATALLFGSWVGKPDRALIKALMPFHRWYSRVLLGGA